jgi:hypothetical protein
MYDYGSSFVPLQTRPANWVSMYTSNGALPMWRDINQRKRAIRRAGRTTASPTWLRSLSAG